MSTILNFSDLGCLNDSAAGSAGAGMASFVRAEFPAVRGFAVTPAVLSDYLKKPEIAASLGLHRKGAEEPEESWRSVKSVFARTRLPWNREMDILTGFSELDTAVSVVTATRHGTASTMIYCSTGEDLLEAIKYCWLKWLRGNIDSVSSELPAILVREIPDSEVSVELRKKGSEIKARAVFGLPEGLADPSVSSDIFEFSPEGKLDRMEMRPQSFQYILKGQAPSKVEIAPGFREEEKLSGEMIAQLEPVMAFMLGNPAIQMCSVCFVSSRPMICSATLASGTRTEIPARAQSISLLQKAVPDMPQASAIQAPVVAARLFLLVSEPSDLNILGDSYADGIIIGSKMLAGNDSKVTISKTAAEAKRRLRISSVIMEISDTGPQTMGSLASSIAELSAQGLQIDIQVPGIRSGEELSRAVRAIRAAVPDRVSIWVRVMYPSNLFFMEEMAAHSDVLALDLDSLGRLMLGSEPGVSAHYSVPTLEKALEQTFAQKTRPLAVISEDLVSTPGLLEFLIRKGADTICVKPAELTTVRHIAASVEKRMLLERRA